MTKHRKRRQRRAARAGILHGRSAKPTHRLKAGRTGNVHAKKTAPKKREAYVGAPPRSVVESCTCSECGARPGELHNAAAHSRVTVDHGQDGPSK